MRYFLFCLLGLNLALSVGCDNPVGDDDATGDDDDGGNDDDGEMTYTFTVAAPIELERVTLDEVECAVEDGMGLCETDQANAWLDLEAYAENRLFVDMVAKVSAGELLIDGNKVCEFDENGGGCAFTAWTEQYQYCLAPNDDYVGFDGGPRPIETVDVDGECHIIFLWNGAEFPVDVSEFGGMWAESNVDVGTISDDLQEIYYHMNMWDGSEIEETLTLD